MKRIAAVLVLVVASAVWGYRLWSPTVPTGQSLRDIAGIEGSTLSIQVAKHGHRVVCQIVNRRQQFDEQVVLRVALVDAAGRTLAVNPLASASTIAPGEARELIVMVPSPAETSKVSAEVMVSLVRWKN